MNAPLLVVVTGMPPAGKTTIAESLAERLHLPLVAKDELKESLFETLGELIRLDTAEPVDLAAVSDRLRLQI